MVKAYKTELNPTAEQKELINKTIGTCRFIYNFYISYNKDVYKKENRFVGGMEFSKWLNNSFIPSNPDFVWIKEVSSKSVKKSIMNAECAFKRFFKKQAKFPKFKKKKDNSTKMYFVKADSRTIIPCERHRIKIPLLGWVRLKEKGYIPYKKDSYIIKSGTISVKAGRYYLSVLVEEPELQKLEQTNEGIGIDLGIKNFAVLSDDRVFKNINKTHVVRKLNKQLERKQRSLSRKYEALKRRNKKEVATRQNIQKNVLEVQKLYQRINNIRTNYINQCVAEVVKTKPQFVTLEDLNVKGMMKNRHLSKAVAEQGFYSFRDKLTVKCKQLGIEVRIAGRFFPSSKMCHKCGAIKPDLKLSDRRYRCDCGYENDRDFNASLNLRDLKVYKLA